MIACIRQPTGGVLGRAAATLVCLSLLATATRLLAADDEARQTVRLVVDYGDGVQVHFTALTWREGMTVIDVLEAAKKHAHGVTFAQRGTGTGALVTQIGDAKNEGRGKNWLFSVNEKLSKVGAGAYQLKPGDAILWEFKVYEYN